ncbi:hypothetical protein B0T26DRAFT_745670 [Lasiosphaeria miniovina]|uniref:Uncharacterized protein n=2 Tax=Lasiosphaeria TaxID=92901 RepID=A0AA40BG99_9PEZI|nr:uncharacterized protein B0T26DRAFT_745670 [Lasiosphaeria miniovina]KAK0733646.1 hypothetical protein B0T26DRAFT_745670 [Lasiosphaeria miniovina]KAK3383609.1 hypothetical protein B0T24DRAFT_673460 [Lasiosphaeria ovina]
MGAVVSCIGSLFRTVGRVIMAIINGIGSIIMAIVNGVVTFLDIIVGFLTCQGCGGRRGGRRRMGRTHHHTSTI